MNRRAAAPTVVVLNGYSRHNTGDWLLFEEAIRLARARHPTARIVGVAMDPDSFAGRTHADEVVPAPIAPGRMAVGLLGVAGALLTKGRIGAAAAQALRRATAVYSVGGGFLQVRSAREAVTVGLVHGVQLLLARRCGHAVSMLPQSVGPFASRAYEWFGRAMLRSFSELRVRDEASRVRVARLGLAQSMTVAPDMVFTEMKRPTKTARPRTVGVVVRNWWFPGSADARADEARYLAAIAGMIERLREEGLRVEMVVHSDGPTARGDDRIATDRVRALLSSPITVQNVCGAHSIEEAIDMYTRFDVVVAVRMHAALLAARVGASVVPIAYEGKTSEIFGQLGAAERVVRIEEVEVDRCAALVLQPMDTRVVDRSWQTLTASLETAGLVA